MNHPSASDIEKRAAEAGAHCFRRAVERISSDMPESFKHASKVCNAFREKCLKSDNEDVKLLLDIFSAGEGIVLSYIANQLAESQKGRS